MLITCLIVKQKLAFKAVLPDLATNIEFGYFFKILWKKGFFATFLEKKYIGSFRKFHYLERIKGYLISCH